MSRATKEVSSYDVYTLTIHMPEGYEGCQYCPALRNDRDRDMRYCWQTGEMLPNYKTRCGDRCPLVMQIKED